MLSDKNDVLGRSISKSINWLGQAFFLTLCGIWREMGVEMGSAYTFSWHGIYHGSMSVAEMV